MVRRRGLLSSDMVGAILWVVLAGVLWRANLAVSLRPKTYTYPESVHLTDGSTFDYIVVGAGAAGSAVAARLALAGQHVLLLEAGGDPDYLSGVPGAAQALMGSSLDWQYQTISNNMSCLAYRDRQCRFSRGRCLGGSTAINFMMHTRGSPQDWDQMNIPGWTWDDIKPYFLKFEGLKDLALLPNSSIPYHNTTGPMRMEFFTDSENPWHSRLINGFKSLNIPFNPDVNAESQIGVTQVVGYVYKNERMSTARGYLARSYVKKRLKVAKFTRCTGVILDDNNVAKGVTVSYGLFQVPLKLYVKKEVILSAGTIGTPQILMLSGIGPAEHLRELNIPVKIDLPVGNNMTDHLLPLVFVKVDKGSGVDNLLETGSKVDQVAQLLLLKKGPLTSNGLTDVSVFLNTKCYDFDDHKLKNVSADCDVPSTQFILAYIDRTLAFLGGPLFQHGIDLNDNVTEQVRQVNRDYALIVVTPLVLQAKSSGTVRLSSPDPLAPPAIYPNFLSDERDMDEMLRALLILEDLLETEPLKRHKASIVRLAFDDCPSYEDDARGWWRCYCRQMTHTAYHAVGTAGLGRAVDAALRVRGARGLRLADASVLPTLCRGNMAAPTIAVGERLADIILHGDDGL